VAITGKIGAGKTSLFNAIGWCIFGSETQQLIESKDRSQENEMGIPNEFSFENDRTQVLVELDITLDHGYKNMSRLIIKRSAVYYKNNVHLPSHTDVDVVAYDTYNQPVDVNEKAILEELMPREISSFYIFDGEYLQKTAMRGGTNVKQGIDKLFKLEKFQNLSQYFTDILKHYASEKKQQSKLIGKAREIDDQITNNMIEIYGLEQEIENLRDTKDQLNNDIQQLSDEIQGILYKAESFGKFKELSNNLKELRTQRESANIGLKKTILQNAYILNSKDVLNKVREKLNKNKLVIDKKLPPEIRVEFLSDLLKDRKCICSRPLEVGTSEYNTVSNLLEQFKEVSTEEYLIDLKYKIEQALNIKDLLDKIESYRKNISQLTTSIETKTSEILSLNISEDEESSADSTITRYKELQSKDQGIGSQLKEIETTINDKLKRITDLTSENKKLEGDKQLYPINDSETSILDEREKIARILQRFFKKFSERAIEKFAQVLENNINDILSKNLILSKFQVKIPYHEGVISFKFTQDGQERYYFSGGQSQLIGIVLMAGFVNVMQNAMKSSVSIPFVVMDHPTSHADRNAEELIHREIGNLFNGTQVVYLTTDSEFPDLIKRSNSRLGSAYSITNNDSLGSDFKKEVI
jgi:DNA sulfur modification protein DndD